MNDNARKSAALAALMGVLGLLSTGCNDEAAQGRLAVTIYGEEYIEDRIPAADMIDGWEVTFSKFLVAVGGVEADGTPLEGGYVFDLRQSSGGTGHGVGGVEVEAGVVEILDYTVGPASADATGNASADDVAAMADAGDSIWVAGTAVREDVTMSFQWHFATTTPYVACETAQDVPSDGEATSQITIHADHLFYDDLDSAEPNVAFDLIASADADADGDVTEAELRALDITGQARYQVGSRDITDLWSFIEAQTETLGHIDGEGHCDVAQ